MKYLCLGYYNHELMDSRPQEEINAVMAQCRPHLAALYQSGHLVIDAGLGLEITGIQRTKGKITVSDGLPDKKELLGSAFIVEAADKEEALLVASLHPTVQVEAGEAFGWRLELRPIHHFEQGSSRKLEVD